MSTANMKFTKNVNDNLSVEFDAPNIKAGFEMLAEVDEVLGVDKCGNPKCGSSNLRYSKRTVAGNNYYEMICKDCDHKLAFGQQKVGGALFPRRWDTKAKQPIGPFKNGWLKYIPKDEDDE